MNEQPLVDRTFEMEFLDPGVHALDFTFDWKLRGTKLSATLHDHKGDKEMIHNPHNPGGSHEHHRSPY
jgi:hypothetical protein